MHLISNRLQYFFKPRSWVLIQIHNTVNFKKLLPLITACKHWGCKLEFPINWEDIDLNSIDSTEYWYSVFPGLAMLHNRKQSILISKLLEEFNPIEASKLFARKLNLNIDSEGYLLYFDENRQTWCHKIKAEESGKDWAEIVKQSFLNHVFIQTTNHPENVNLDYEDIEWLESRERKNRIPSGVLDLIYEGIYRRNSIIAETQEWSLLREAQSEIPELILNRYDNTLIFDPINIQTRLSPQQMAIYYLYLNHPEGFTNKNRIPFKEEALNYYRRFKSTDNRERSDTAILNCFNPRDDKNFRDAVFGINSKIKSLFDSIDYALPFLISGNRGGIKKITLPRDKFHERN